MGKRIENNKKLLNYWIFPAIILFFFSNNNLSATDIHVPGTPYSINCVDFDLDGDIDLVVGCNSYEGDTIAIFLNDGYGNFEAIYHPKANNLFYTQCADMNGDGLPDVITINDDLKYGYYTNLGNGSLGDWHYIFDFTGEMLAEAKDFDNNGFNDLLYYQNLNPGKWGIVYNYGNNSFINQIQYSCTKNFTSICSGYLDEDTLRDVLIVSPDLSQGSKIFYNNGDSFIQSPNCLPRSMAGFIIDIDNDDYLDIALANSGILSSVTLFKNFGGDNFEYIDTINLPEESSIKGFPDLNNDNYPDIFHRTSLPSIGFDEIHVSYNDFNWGFLTPHNYIIGEPSMPITQNYGDLNGDGYIDFVLANYLPGRLMKILWNDGTGQFVINNPVFLDENKNQVVTHFKVYPNPFSDELNISIISEHVNTVRLRISNIMGRDACKPEDIKLTNGDNTINVNLPELPKGIYFYALNIDNRIIHTGKIIKK